MNFSIKRIDLEMFWAVGLGLAYHGHMHRRHLLPALALPALTAVASPADAPAPRRTRIGVSSYSFWHFRGPKFPLERVIDEAGRMGFDGVEILHRQMDSEAPAYVNGLKRRAFENGLPLFLLSIHQDFVDPDTGVRQKDIDHTKRCIDLAARLGIPAIRVNSGRWNTIHSFDDLMKVKGNEPPVAGYTDEDALKWVVECLQQCLPMAAEAGVLLALENHWGLTTDPRRVIQIVNQVRSPWLGVNADTGNYAGDPYEGLAVLARQATIVQAKTYYGGGEWYTLNLDYPRIARILRDAGFRGWVSLEMEGKEDPLVAVPKSLRVLKDAFGA
jgi:sugar phosphate isomerase/epimerase